MPLVSDLTPVMRWKIHLLPVCRWIQIIRPQGQFSSAHISDVTAVCLLLLRLLHQEWLDGNVEHLKFQARMLSGNTPKCLSSWKM